MSREWSRVCIFKQIDHWLEAESDNEFKLRMIMNLLKTDNKFEADNEQAIEADW